MPKQQKKKKVKRERKPEEGEQHHVQEGAQVPVTFEEMLSRCEEQTESAHDSTKITFEMWDVMMRRAAHHMEPNMDCDNETPGTCQDDDKVEVQVRRSHGTNMSMSQVDPKFQTHMASCAPPEMKV